MNVIAYSRFRRQGFRHAWRYEGMTQWLTSAVSVILTVALAAVLVLWVDDSQRDCRPASMANQP